MKKGIFTATNVPDGSYILTEKKNFIQPTFYHLYRDEENPVCVAVVHSEQVMLIALMDLVRGHINLLHENAIQTGKEHATFDVALQDFNGLENTKHLSAAGSAIATEVLGHTLLGHPCHIPSLGEWVNIFDNKYGINSALLFSGKSPLKNGWYLTSTYSSDDLNFFFFFGSGCFCKSYQFAGGFVRCVSSVKLSNL